MVNEICRSKLGIFLLDISPGIPEEEELTAQQMDNI